MKIESDVSNAAPTSLEMQRQAKLVDAAQQFEATMLQELLKPMQDAGKSWDQDVDTTDASGDAISTLGTESVAKAISKAGGFGIAKQVTAQISIERQQRSRR